ncbi:paraquat-inducible protein A [Tropicimonas marinistellae]|uniref:paraquat-inducible protein A n=1 Tax=Tropicimonas marinistellae TaxID=1739787 RepID=UPI00082BA2CB|nr:paraquat-inducible protein A [Tropicimonas marinistellae]
MTRAAHSHRDLDDLIACPTCDALYRVHAPQNGERAVCARCHTVLIAPVEGAIFRIVALALAILILLITALFMPFLKIEANGLSNATSIYEAALSFSKAHMVALSVGVMALIIFVPIARALLLIYVLGPLMIGRPPLPAARAAFRLSEDLRPWSMAEIFVLGVGVALVKVADLARVELGAAFWLFAALVVVSILQDGTLCRWSVWHALEEAGPEEAEAGISQDDAVRDVAHG